MTLERNGRLAAQLAAMTRRNAAIAMQAIVVGALVVIVYLTLLKPEESRPLFGVDSDQDSPLLATPPLVDAEPGRRESRPAEPGGGASAPVSGSGPAPTQTPSGTVSPAAPGPAGDEDPESSPGVEQYADTVTRLMTRLYEEG